MWPLGLSLVLVIALFIHYVNKQRPTRELIIYSLLSLIGITQLVLLIFEKPIRVTVIIASIIDLLFNTASA
ncbi:hypothetical protein [Paenibacillus agricola]|uniref:Uncharacterized protein n=1 Tax=Paenibacillus agricola TaxID=2716264 RepID=A0ABX0J587_9BACL|nr:hypothetical protein [Paenibacillus agricola]NHN31490.1 hypothetical protein [Paenibacillus agricola]